MGQTLSEPIVDKHSNEGEDDRMVYGASCMQGWRISMEDAHTTLLNIDDCESSHSFFGVYDGHGGNGVAKYSGKQLHMRIAKDEAFKKRDYATAIKNGFLGTDVDLREDPEYVNEPSGCTAVVALITPDNRLFVGNAGDSRAVVCVNGEAIDLSHDHKPVNKDESARIVAAGGYVEFGRVNGNLALSRAIGDFEFKRNETLPAEQQVVTANPDIQEHKLTDEVEFLVLACDGIWDCMSSQEVIDFVRREIARKESLAAACEHLMDRCLAPDSEIGGVGCDNMTVIIIGFLNGRTKEEWYDWMAKKVPETAQVDRFGNTIPSIDGQDEEKAAMLVDEKENKVKSEATPTLDENSNEEDEVEVEIDNDNGDSEGKVKANSQQVEIQDEDNKQRLLTQSPNPISYSEDKN
ncbi:uncharacterized protein VTP21DRAFT_5877 [Calcarisporiella thermophila]|uniref:uncharacterized protein n=1 Tax=Calcarisporiella thermophila TaxID=911321 RepID=UPI003742875C